jgi:hypothetical protein
MQGECGTVTRRNTKSEIQSHSKFGMDLLPGKSFFFGYMNFERCSFSGSWASRNSAKAKSRTETPAEIASSFSSVAGHSPLDTSTDPMLTQIKRILGNFRLISLRKIGGTKKHGGTDLVLALNVEFRPAQKNA